AINRHGIGVPFVDYARGDGAELGPGGDRDRNAAPVDDETPGLRGYRRPGGRATGAVSAAGRPPAAPPDDPAGATRPARAAAPARRSWSAPLAVVGLQQAAPTEEAARAQLRAHVEALDRTIEELEADIERRRDEMRRLDSARMVLVREAHSRPLSREYDEKLE